MSRFIQIGKITLFFQALANNMFRCLDIRSRLVRDSFSYSSYIIGLISTILSICDFSLTDLSLPISKLLRTFYVVIIFLMLTYVVYHLLKWRSQKQIDIKVGGTSVCIRHGDIFKTEGIRVIGCDTHFETRVKSKIISKKSLHGQFLLHHGDKKKIKRAVEKEARNNNRKKNKEGGYSFPLGTIVEYENTEEKQTYLMLAMTELNKDFNATTNMTKFTCMLTKMWKEINKKYDGGDIVLPLLGGGITRFEGKDRSNLELLGNMILTLRNSDVTFRSKVIILIHDKKFPLYELKDAFSFIQ